MKLIYLFILIFISINPTIFANDPNWEFKIELDKEEYLLGENIWLDVTITNVSEEVQLNKSIICLSGYGFKFSVINSDKKKLQYMGSYTAIWDSEYPTLIEPEGKIRKLINLKDQFKNLSRLPDEYQLQGNVELPFESECLLNNLTSNTLSFKIIEPDNEVKDVIALYQLADSLYKRTRFRDISLDMFEKLLNKYPNSIISEKCFGILKYNEYEEKNVKHDGDFYPKLNNEMLKNFPESESNFSYLKTITYDMNYKKKVRYLKKIVKKYPDSKSADYASFLLKSIERKTSTSQCIVKPDENVDWDFKISMSKNRYKQYEKFWVDLTLTNISNDTLGSDCIIAAQDHGLEFIITDSTGNRLQFNSDWTICYAGNNNKTFLIEPGGQVFASIELTQYFSPLYRCSDKYTIKAKFDLGKYRFDPYMFDNLESNILTIWVDEQTQSEKLVYDTYRRLKHGLLLIFNQSAQDCLNADTVASQKEQLRELWKENKNSVYAEQLFRDYMYYTIDSLWNDSLRVHNNVYIRNEMLTKFPNSGDSIGRLRGFVYYFSLIEKLTFYSEVLKTLPNTRAAKFAQQEIYREMRPQVYKQ